MSKSSKGEQHEKRFKVNQSVMAQWPGGKLWYRGTVIRNSPYYEVKFEDGSKHKTPAQGIESLKNYTQKHETSRGRGRQRSPSTAKSPPRPVSRSRSRSAGRNKPAPVSSRSRTSSKSPKSPEGQVRQSKRSKDKDEEKAKAEIKNPTKAKVVENSVTSPSTLAITRRTAVVAIKTVNTNNKEGLRNRTPIVNEKSESQFSVSRASARIAALQTARVAGIVTPELSFESRDLLKKEVNKSHKTSVKGTKRHFGGAFGALFLTLAVPAIVLIINIMCTKNSCTIMKWPIFSKNINYYVSLEGSAAYISWVLFQALLYAVPIGRVTEGQLLLDGTRLKYRMNGFWNFIISMAALGGALYYYKPPVTLFNRHFIPTLTTSIMFSLLLAVVLYIKSHWTPYYARSLQGNTGNILYDFFIGREMNPRIFRSFDLKTFVELRLGVIGWAAINVLLLYKDIRELGQPSYPLLLCAGFQLFLCADVLYFEEAFLSTMDVTTEALGFMLVLGSLTFMPFIFTINSRFIQLYHPKYHWGFLVSIGFLSLLGYYIFRASNLQKSKFRKNRFDPSIAGLKTIQTGRPKEILAGGWWGFLRHPNYFGDLLVALSLCLYAGVDYIIPYAYLFYLLILLCHRAIRDDDLCRQKYGSAWDEYCSRVRHRIFPKVF